MSTPSKHHLADWMKRAVLKRHTKALAARSPIALDPLIDPLFALPLNQTAIERAEHTLAEVIAELGHAHISRTYLARMLADIREISLTSDRYVADDDLSASLRAQLRSLVTPERARDPHQWWMLWTALSASVRFSHRMERFAQRLKDDDALSCAFHRKWVQAWEDAVGGWALAAYRGLGLAPLSIARLDFAHAQQAPVHTVVLHETGRGEGLRIRALALQFRAPGVERVEWSWSTAYIRALDHLMRLSTLSAGRCSSALVLATSLDGQVLPAAIDLSDRPQNRKRRALAQAGMLSAGMNTELSRETFSAKWETDAHALPMLITHQLTQTTNGQCFTSREEVVEWLAASLPLPDNEGASRIGQVIFQSSVEHANVAGVLNELRERLPDALSGSVHRPICSA